MAELLKTGGHIGDGIRPGERGKGYATAMLALALDECKKLGINKVLMCCDKDNRIFVGIVIICGAHKYCIPLSSPKEKHKK